MITTRTRILSFLATVAMLVSMFACFVIPASAAEDASFYRTGWQKVLQDIREYANYSDNQVLKAAVDGWLAIKNTTEVNDWVAFGTTHANALKTAIEAHELNWITFGTENDNMGNGVPDYPMYQYHEFYEAVGYAAYEADKTQWSISAPADWLEMVAVSTYDATNNPTPETFEGEVFHLTKNIEFGNTEMAPLSPGEGSITDPTSGTVTTYLKYQENSLTNPFNGTIEGHGYGFNDIKVVGNGPSTDKNVSFGLIAKLGPKAYINDFGVNSGTITATGKAKSLYLSTFGDPVSDFQGGFKSGAPSAVQITGVRLNKVWSGASIDEGSCTATNKYAAGILMLARDSQVEINGAYFFGSLTAAKGTAGLFYDIKGGEDVYNSLSNTTANVAISLNKESSTGNALNNYFVGSGALFNYTPTALVTTGSSTTAAASAEAAAYEINKLQNTSPVAGVDKVYYTIAAGGIRPNGTEANKIVKLTVNDEEKYINNGAQLTKADLAAVLDKSEGAIVGVTDANGEVTFPYTVSGDATFTATINESALVADAWEPYATMEPKYLAAGADSAWTAAYNAVEAVAAGTGAAADATAAIAAFETALAENGTYATYEQEDDGKQIPGFALAGTYGEYNKNNVWAITSPADWEAMDVLADDGVAYPTKSLLFDGYTFHLYDDVDFENEEMTPLGWESTKFPYYSATINGHGYGFSRINIKGEAGATSLGLIKCMGNCTFIDFGINSGTITSTSASAAGGISNFGMVYPVEGVTATFTRVWSGATLKAECDTHVSALAGTYNYRSIQVDVDGFTFYGKVDYASAGAYTMAYGVVGGHSSAPGDHGKFANIITYPELNVPKAVISDVEYPSTAIFGFSSADAYAAAKVENLSNVYGIGFEKAYRAAGGTSLTGSNNATANAINKADGRVFVETAELQYAGTPGAAAYDLNGKDLGYYFTFAADGGIRPTTTAANRVVKYATIANGEAADPIYANAGAAVDVAALLPQGAELVSVADTEGTINAEDGKYPITGDVTISYTISADEEEINALKAALADKIAEVEAFIADKVNLDMKYFKAGAISAEDWLAKAKSEALEDLRAAKAHLENGDLVIAMKDDYPNFPAYKDHAKYEAYQPENANWLIADPADWYEMNKVMNEGANGAYFANTTFHLVEDVDFGHISEWDADVACPEVEEGAAKIPGYTLNEDYMLPLGNYGTKTFSGTIDGHGYGFENVYVSIFVSTSQIQADYGYYQEGYDQNYAGLISKIQQATFKNFGVNSGVIDAKGGANNANASTFGAIYLNGTTFKNVWSGAKVMAISNANPSGLAGLYNNKTYAIDVDGFTFYGELSKVANARTMVYGITGANKGAIDGSTIKNVILYPTFDVENGSVPASADGEKYASAIFGFSSKEAYAAATISNVYGIGFEKAYRASVADLNSTDGRVFEDDANISLTIPENSTKGAVAKDKARELNAIGAETGVYYKLDANGNLRPTAEATNFVKITVTLKQGETQKDKYLYVYPNVEYTNEYVHTELGIKSNHIITNLECSETVTYANGSSLIVTGDGTMTIEFESCNHKDADGNDLNEYTHIDGTKKHTALCTRCGTTSEKNCSIAWVAGAVAEDGTSNHTGACTLCVSPEYTEECNGVDTPNPNDCTADHTWNFTCKVHEATYPAGKGNDTHTFTGDWKDVEGTNKQTDKCANCTTVQSRINENVDITNSEFILTTKGNGEIIVKLPEGIKSAKLAIAVEGAYTFEIEGMTPVDGYYAIAEGTTSVTVKVTADVTATGGKLTATLSDVVAIDEYFEIAGEKVAEIEIGFEGTMYDADGNGTINLADALAALYVKAGKTDAPDINLANVDTNASGEVDIEEVYAIVQKWLSDVIGTL